MFKKIGSLKSHDENGPIIIENTEGKNFEVNSIVAFIWSRLDGSTTTDSISQQISSMADINETEAHAMVQEAITALEGVSLVTAC